jgi:hypothetical protein
VNAVASTYRVELWIGVGEPDRMPEVNVKVRARSDSRALRVAAMRAQRASGEQILIEDSHVYEDPGDATLTLHEGEVCECCGIEPKIGERVYAFPIGGGWAFLCAKGFESGSCSRVFPSTVRRVSR